MNDDMEETIENEILRWAQWHKITITKDQMVDLRDGLLFECFHVGLIDAEGDD